MNRYLLNKKTVCNVATIFFIELSCHNLIDPCVSSVPPPKKNKNKSIQKKASIFGTALKPKLPKVKPNPRMGWK